MTHASHKPDLSRIGQCAFTEVLATFLSLPTVPRTNSGQERIPDAPDQVAATVSLSGEGHSAIVRILLPLAFVAEAVKRLTGLQGPEGETLHEDTAGEIANMVAGRVAAQLAVEGYPGKLGTPSVSHSASLPAEVRPGTDHGRSDFVCDGHRLSVEIQCCYATQ